MGEKSLNH